MPIVNEKPRWLPHAAERVPTMIKVLIVDPHDQRRRALAEALGRLGATVKAASDALYALTFLERSRPDVLVLAPSVTGMDAVEVGRIVREDAATSEVPVVMISPPADQPLPATLFDLIIDPSTPSAEIARTILQLTKASVRPPTHTRIAAQTPHLDDDAQNLHGTLAILNFPELTQALCNSRKTGKLEIELERGSAEVFFYDGQVIHAQSADLSGLPAFREVLAAALDRGDATFLFTPLSKAEIFRCPHTINMTPQRLLLAMAVQLDERRLERAPEGPRAGRDPQ